jgi:hypothetical protein
MKNVWGDYRRELGKLEGLSIRADGKPHISD